MSRHRCLAGFSKLGLLVLFVIVSLSVAYVWPKLVESPKPSGSDVALEQLRILESALQAYRRDVGRYPRIEEGFAALTSRPAGVDAWRGPYMNQPVPLDPWGRPYQYRIPGLYGAVDIYSLGSDPDHSTAVVLAARPHEVANQGASVGIPSAANAATSSTSTQEGVRTGQVVPGVGPRTWPPRPEPFTGPAPVRGRRVSPPLEEVYEPPQ